MSGAADDIVTKASSRSVADTVDRLLGLLGAKGLKVFAIIDQRAEARAVGLNLRETTLVVFGNPAAGTGVMEAAPLSALDLPLKVLVWADGERGTQVSYTAPSALAARYGLTAEQAAAFEGIEGLTDALVSS
jgi:uncharacterized protein (DUF302 family)